MTKPNHLYLLKYFYVIILFISSLQVNSQSIFSEFALTGKGDLVLEGSNIRLQPEVFEAYKNMQAAALEEGISIKIVSAYRSYNRQKNIWNRKYNKYISEGLSPKKAIDKIIEYSTIPGTSRHHWGTDIDIIDSSVQQPDDVLIEENYNANGVYENLKKWMDNNAEKFGFYLVYTNDENRKGFKYEPWHYSYLPISKLMLQEYSKIDLLKLLEASNLKGKKYVTKDFIEIYYFENILDINSDLK
ncbi:M15 family metallopeptidase [Lutibacter sp. B1]|uniref:M15 family metallopeptidase n=1 Tax=Lutibacter sp. B1 TaxID=2725996 RepID=UPI0014572BBE|nr:M15 family metallopeptidase [Lutibacter sp. B1]NLP57948.1 M15 family metallopeptidase [Lutibacter sp. B1]